MGIEQQHNPNYDIPGVTKAGEEPKKTSPTGNTPPPSAPPQNIVEEKHSPVIETYASDMAEAIRTEEGTVIKAALAEEKKREIEAEAKSPRGKKNMTYILGGAVFVILAIVIVALVATHTSAPNPVSQNQGGQPLIYADQNKNIDVTNLSKEQIAAAVSNEEKIGTVPAGTIENIIFTESGTNGAIGSVQFFQSIGSTVPPSLLRALGDTYMLGVYHPAVSAGGDMAGKPFIILPVTSRDGAFLGMKTWEKTMLDDLFLLFGTDVSGTRASLFQAPFTDTLLQNLNARVLYDDASNPVLLYVFANDSTLVITDDTATLAEVLNRLRAEKSAPAVLPN